MRELPVRRRLPHLPPSWDAAMGMFFITIACRPRGVNQLANEQTGRLIFESFAEYQAMGRWQASNLLLMPDHLHALMTFSAFPGMGKSVREWKRYSARQFGVKWQRDFFDHRMRTSEEFLQTVEYICQNPVRKGLVAEAGAWPYVWDWRVLAEAAKGVAARRAGPSH